MPEIDFKIAVREIKVGSRKMRLPCLFTAYYKGIPVTTVVKKFENGPTMYFYNMDAIQELERNIDGLQGQNQED